MTKLIVLDEMIGSMTEFKQIIGRGTRLREKEGKTHFVVMDFRNVTRLFADPDWDGPIMIDPGSRREGRQHHPLRNQMIHLFRLTHRDRKIPNLLSAVMVAR